MAAAISSEIKDEKVSKRPRVRGLRMLARSMLRMLQDSSYRNSTWSRELTPEVYEVYYNDFVY
jgi:hypothetical protein